MSAFDENIDFVIVGSGAGSMCAALVMRQQGYSVSILEKSELLGGTTAKSGGVLWIPNNQFLARDGVEDSYEKAKTYLDELAKGNEDSPGATQERRDTYLKESPKMLDYLLSNGIVLDRVPDWPDCHGVPGSLDAGRTVASGLFNMKELGPWRKKVRKGFLPIPLLLADALQLGDMKHRWSARWMFIRFVFRFVFQLVTGKRRVSAGLALQGQMLKACLDAGVEFYTESPVGGLIVENGKVQGIETVRDGKNWRISANKGVLVNAGGFAHNQAMRDKYQPGARSEWSNVIESDTGDLITEMMRHGAAVNNMDVSIGFPTFMAPGKEDAYVKPGAQAQAAAPHAIMVDQRGERYMNEGVSEVACFIGMMERNQSAPAIPSWVVVDARGVKAKGIAGARGGKIRKWLEMGYLKTGNTIEELATAMEADPATLRSTVDRFNQMVASGRDTDFGRGDSAYNRYLGDKYHQPSPTLDTIEEGPFYAAPVVPGDVSTYGGVVTDECARVLREDGSVIEGLYATGVSTASAFGRCYPGAGASIGPAFTWGYVAAKHAAGISA